MTATESAARPWWRPSPTAAAAWTTLLAFEATLVGTYLLASGARITRPEILVVPFVWINLALWVFARVRPAPTPGGRRVAAAIGLGYFVLLAVVSGVVSPGGGTAVGTRLALSTIPPGWAPALFVDGAAIDVAVIPYQVVGYAALAYLVYVVAREASGALAGGLVGLFSCVSCTFPVVAGLLGGFTGGSALAAAASVHAYVLSTAVFVLTVGLLAWRPDPRDLRSALSTDR